MNNFTQKLWLFVLLLWAATAVAQQRAEDRWQYLEPGASVTDDPRRVPRPPHAAEAEGAIVLRGGLIFDGTGASARAGTLVIEGNRIASLLPPAATAGWPADAKVIDVSGLLIAPGLNRPGFSGDSFV